MLLGSTLAAEGQEAGNSHQGDGSRGRNLGAGDLVRAAVGKAAEPDDEGEGGAVGGFGDEVTPPERCGVGGVDVEGEGPRLPHGDAVEGAAPAAPTAAEGRSRVENTKGRAGNIGHFREGAGGVGELKERVGVGAV